MHNYTHEQRVALREQDWSLNVRDEFKNLDNQTIKNILNNRRNKLIFAFEIAIRDFNFSALIRVSNAFACQGVMYTGFKKFNPKGAVGTVHYENVTHLAELDFEEAIDKLKHEGYRFVVAESDVYAKSQSIIDYKWNERSIVMLGEESIGVSQKWLDLADDIVYIPMRGSVRSLNCAGAGHIIAYDYAVKTNQL